jgi:hypothetical protein
MKATSTGKTEIQAEGAALDRCYGKIGISAVAAALPYQSESKNQAYAPVTWQRDERFVEMVA